MATPVYNEGAAFEVYMEFEDVNGVPTMPTTAHWRFVSDVDGSILQDWTQLTPVQSGSKYVVSFQVPGSVNVLTSGTRDREKRHLLIVADKDLPGEWSTPYYLYTRWVGR